MKNSGVEKLPRQTFIDLIGTTGDNLNTYPSKRNRLERQDKNERKKNAKKEERASRMYAYPEFSEAVVAQLVGQAVLQDL